MGLDRRQATQRSVWRAACKLCDRAVLALLCLLACPATAQEVGTVAALEGSAQIGRGGAWLDATVGTAIEPRDELRTGRPGRLRIVFQDDTVLTLSDDSRVVVDEAIFDPGGGRIRSLLGLLGGRVSALVSEYYQRPGSAYEIKTATAVAGVRGTDFVVRYDAFADFTEVVGRSGRVEVRSTAHPTAPAVFVTAREVTTVARGQLPTLPKRISDTLFRQYIEGIEFISATDSLTVSEPLVSGVRVPQADRAAAVAAARARQPRREIGRGPRDASSLVEQPPTAFGPTGRLRIPF